MVFVVALVPVLVLAFLPVLVPVLVVAHVLMLLLAPVVVLAQGIVRQAPGKTVAAVAAAVAVEMAMTVRINAGEMAS
ncbi:MAG: hypothetical protein M3Y65_25315 [Pseudomonadota bacterium]|nr:hypothetical protein [Pseudomonadota bacterium]